jgi:hypothetical protein
LISWTGFSGLGEESIPQGLKPLSSSSAVRPKAEALGYLEAKASAEASASAKAKASAEASASATAKASAEAIAGVLRFAQNDKLLCFGLSMASFCALVYQ